MFLDFAEDNAKRRQQIFLKDWRERLDAFLEFNEREVLPDAGKVSREDADVRALAEFEAFAERRRRLREDEEAARLAEEALRQLDNAGKQAESARKSQNTRKGPAHRKAPRQRGGLNEGAAEKAKRKRK
jgi:hypothetical protein